MGADAKAYEQFAEQYDGALENARKLAANGDLEAMKAVAFFLRVGRSMKENNMDAAFPYYQKAADMGDAESAYIVASHLSDKGNKTLALKYYQKGADAGDNKCQFFCGIMYQCGDGCTTNKILAEKYLRASALQNDPNAQGALGELLWGESQNTPDDTQKYRLIAEAVHWLAYSYLNGNKTTAETLNELGILRDEKFQSILRTAKKDGFDFDSFSVNLLGRTASTKTYSSVPTSTTSTVRKEMPSQNTTKATNGCYIATAVYGSYDCPEVWTFRRFRDNYLANFSAGRLFIKAYYLISPKLVKLFGESVIFKRFWKRKLDKLAITLKEKGFDDTPYQD